MNAKPRQTIAKVSLPWRSTGASLALDKTAHPHAHKGEHEQNYDHHNRDRSRVAELPGPVVREGLPVGVCPKYLGSLVWTSAGHYVDGVEDLEATDDIEEQSQAGDVSHHRHDYRS